MRVAPKETKQFLGFSKSYAVSQQFCTRFKSLVEMMMMITVFLLGIKVR